MLTLVLSIIVVIAVLLVLVILAQNSKGGGLSSQFGGSGASNMIGVKKTGDLLSNLTWGFIVALFLLTISTNFMTIEKQGATDEFIDRAQEQQTIPSLDLGDVDATEDAQPLDLEGSDDTKEEDSE